MNENNEHTSLKTMLLGAFFFCFIDVISLTPVRLLRAKKNTKQIKEKRRGENSNKQSEKQRNNNTKQTKTK